MLAARGIARLPSTLRESLDAFLADDVLRTAFGRPLVGAITAVRESEIDAVRRDVTRGRRRRHPLGPLTSRPGLRVDGSITRQRWQTTARPATVSRGCGC